MPYEVFHCGARFVVALLAGCGHAAAHGPDVLARALGPSVDLLVWIPKSPAAASPGEMRPLQLPAASGGFMARGWCLKLWPPSACVAGWCARRHMRCQRARRLQASHQGGPDAGPVVSDAHAAATPPTGRGPAILFADQSKAFERLGHDRLNRVLRGWRMPGWLRWGLLGVCAGRAVRSASALGLGPARAIRCGVGMGGGGGAASGSSRKTLPSRAWPG